MPNEHLLKTLVDGFTVTSKDFVKWAQFLDVRAAFVHKHLGLGGLAPTFGDGVDQVDPPPKNVAAYPPVNVSFQDAAKSLADIADCQAGMLQALPGGLALVPANPASAETTLGTALTAPALLHLVLGWQQLDVGIFETMMRMYGLPPTDRPHAAHSGPQSDLRLCAVIVSWLAVIQADVNHFMAIQHFVKPAATNVPAAANEHDALVNFEQQYHRLVDNYLLLLTVLPYHLFNAKA